MVTNIYISKCELITMIKKTITTIVRKNDKAIVYNDDGMFCRWTPIKYFNFELISEVKAREEGIVLLVSEEEAKEFNGAKYDDHEAWTIPRDIIWMVYGEYPKAHWESASEQTKELVRFLRTLQI